VTVNLGPEGVQLLIPQRRPFLMVDRVTGFAAGPPPTLTASRYLSANEAVFDGHFPQLAVSPGAWTLEGLAQSCALLVRLESLALADDVLCDELDNLERGFTLQPDFEPERAAALRARLAGGGGLGLAGAVDLKFVAPVFAGNRLDYRVRLERRMGGRLRFQVAASVNNQEVVRGSITAARVAAPGLSS